MDSLVLELQKGAMRSETKVTDLLREALVVARKLAIPEFQSWINSELSGYGADCEIPSYRVIRGEVRAWNPYHGWIPVLMKDAETSRILTQRTIDQSIGELESLILNRKDKTSLLLYFSPEVENSLMSMCGMPFRPSLHIGDNQIHGITEAVRNTVLNWALKLEEDGVLGNGMTFTEDEKNQARKSSNIVIHNFQGILGDVQHSIVSQEMKISIKKGDFGSLTSYLASIGISEADISELEDALQNQQNPVDNRNYGPKVSAWIGKMVAKAAAGSWDLTAATAAGVLAQGLSAYFGFG